MSTLTRRHLAAALLASGFALALGLPSCAFLGVDAEENSFSQADTGGNGGAGGSGGGGQDPANPDAGDDADADGPVATNLLAGTDTCPGTDFPLSPGAGETICQDSTTVHGADYSSYCGVGDGSGKDVVYHLLPSGSGTLTAVLAEQSPGFDGVLYVRTKCDDPASVLACADFPMGSADRLSWAVGIGESYDYYLFVDGRDDTAGDYNLRLSLEPAACGDGVVNEPDGEECDYGDTVAGDGCDPSCHFEAPNPLEDVCSTSTISLTTTEPLTLPGHTIGYADDYAAPCNAAAGGPDRVHRVSTPGLTVPGQLTVSAAADFDVVLSVYTACQSGELDHLVACADSPVAAAPEEVTLDTDQNGVFLVVVDGYGATSYGSYTLTFTLTPGE